VSARTALITGVSGQDGSYLAELLLDKDYEVHALVHRSLGAAQHLGDELVVHRGDLADGDSIARAVAAAAPDEVYHLAALTEPGKSWDEPVRTFEVVAAGTVRVLEAVAARAEGARCFVAGSAEVFGAASEAPQTERAPFAPRNPYGAAKAAAVAAARAYRHGRGLFVAVGLLYNHESPRRPPSFVTRKVTRHAAAIAAGRERQLRIGNLDARRDWGWAPEYVEGAWRMLQADAADDYVLATGALHSVREVVEVAFARAGVPVEGHVVVDDAFVRPEPPVPLVGDPSKARDELGWVASTPFEDVIAAMVDADLAELSA
jgi:GDPmannose 4,6-dehydratase